MSNNAELSSRQLYLRLLGHVRPYWRQFAVAVGAMVLMAISEPAIPALLKPLLDGTFVTKDPASMKWTPILLVGLFFVRGFANFTADVAFEWVSGKVVFDLRRRLFEKILRMPTRYFDDNATGNIISKVSYNSAQVANAATKALTVIVKDSLTVVGLIIYMLWLDWRLTLAVFLLLPLVAWVVRVAAVRMRRLSRQLQSRVGEMTHCLEEAVRGHRVIKIFGGQTAEEKRFEEQSNWVRRYQVKLQVADAAAGPLVEIIGALMLALLIFVGTRETGTGEMLTVGGFVAFLTALGLLFPPIKRLTGVNQPLQRGLAAAESVFDLIDHEPEPDTGDRKIGRAEGRLEFRNVRFRYGEGGDEVLRGVSFVAEPGRTVALVGPSGGGKSTIASLIPRFYLPTDGTILLDGQDIRELTLESLRSNLSMVGQDPMLFNDTLAANIAFGRPGTPDPAELEQVAEAAHATEFIRRLPEGFEALVGEDGVRISGGQRQRIAIARALYKDAPVLILDEATSALDSESERQVQAALRRLTEHRTTIVIAHRLSTIEHADLILVVKGGDIVERGTHGELLAAGGEYAHLYTTQFRRDEPAEQP